MADSLPANQLPDYNDTLRSGVITLVQKINIEGVPVGGFLAYVIGLLWPEVDQSEAQWNTIKKYAERLVNHAIDKERIERLNKRLEGLRNVAKDYSGTSYSSPQKGGHLTSLMNELRLFEPDFWDERNPEKMFPLFTTFGTLWLSALAEQAYKFEEIYGKADPDASFHLKTFHTNVQKYSDAAQRMFDNLEHWRFRQLELTETVTQYVTQSDSKWTFTDRYDNGVDPIFQRDTHGSDWGHSYHNRPGQRAMEIVAQDRVATIRAGFMEDLQNILGTAALWKYLDPSAKRPVLFDVVSQHGQWGEWEHRGPRFDDQPAGISSRITHIKVRAAHVVECLEMFYDGQSAGTHGNPAGGNLSELELDPDESVVEVAGRTGQFLDKVEFVTSKGRKVGGGNDTGGVPFSSTGHPSWKDVSLFAVGGWNDNRRMTGLSLRWRHKTWMEPYTASYKRLGTPLSPFVDVTFKGETDLYVSNLLKELSGRALNQEYFARHGKSPVAQQIHLADKSTGAAGQRLAHGQNVRIWTSEAVAKDYPYLGKFAASVCYYYSAGYDCQLWTILKVVPTDGPVVAGEKVYFQNAEARTYLFATDEGYVGSRSEPYAWEVTPI